MTARRFRRAFFVGLNMAVKISGVLKDGTGKPVQNCTIQLKAKRSRRLSQHLPAQERHQQRPVKHRKVLLLQSPQKARQLPVPVRRKRQKRMRQRHNNQQPLLHPPRPRRRQKQPPQPGMRRPQKRQRNHQKRTHHQAPVVPLPRV